MRRVCAGANIGGMTPTEAKRLVLTAQLSHARLALSASAGNTILASAWLTQVQAIERQLAKLDDAPAPTEAAAA